MIEKVAAGAGIEADYEELKQALADAAEGKSSEPAVAGPARPEPRAETAQPAPPPEQSKVAQAATTAPAAQAAPPGESIRVGLDRLNELIRLSSEITSAHGRSKQRYADAASLHAALNDAVVRARRAGSADPALDALVGYLEVFGKTLKRLATDMRDDLALQELLMRELQERSLKMRMVPLTTIFDTFHRSVRELAASMGKQVEFVVVGEQTEMDKSIVERLGDPLMHMVRNSLDHGIETPEERTAAGKPARGTITLAAGYEGGNVLITVRDDGRGISLDRIRAKAVERGLATAEEIAAFSDAELRGLIFLPGFSTSPIITDVSGRGVGMDVVKKNLVRDLKGAIDIQSEEGAGSTFYIRLPMTLAIMHVVLVAAAGTAVAVPDDFISEIRRAAPGEIIAVLDKRAINIREQLVPVEDLAGALGLPGAAHARRADEALLLVVKVGSERLALVIEEVIDEEDMVIKPLPAHMKSVSMVSGVIVTGRNTVVNVLNIPAVVLAAKQSGMRTVRREKAEHAPESRSVLVVDDSINTREIERSILEAYGYAVTVAGDGMEALEKAKRSRFDMVITDVEMPRMDGFTLTETLRGMDGYRGTPIILLTSRDKEDDKRRGIRVGASAYIVKGDFEQSNLLDTVRDLL
jgi:two-component system chemotaxis sensor kinase CheA